MTTATTTTHGIAWSGVEFVPGTDEKALDYFKGIHLAGTLDLDRAKAAFKGAKDDGLAASLDSLAALGLAVAAGAGAARSWSAVR